MALNYGQMATQPLASGIQTGLQLGQAMRQTQQQDQQQAALQQAAELYQSGTPEQIAQFSIQNPQAGQILNQQIGFKNDATRQNLLDSARNVLMNPENTEQIIKDRVAMVQAEGGDPSDTAMDLERYRQDPEGYLQTVEKAYALMDPKGYSAYKQSMPSQPEQMTQYQQATVEGKRIDQQLRLLDIDEKRLDRQLRRETDTLKKQKLEQELETTRQNKEKAAQQKDADALGSYQAGQDTLDLIDEIMGHEGFESYVGGKGASSLFGIKDEPIRGTAAAGLAGKVETLQSKNFMNAIQNMKGMGSLSDAEGNKVAASVASLSPNMSEKDFKSSLKVIKTLTERGMKKQRKLLGDKAPKKQMTDDDLINKYL